MLARYVSVFNPLIDYRIILLFKFTIIIYLV